MTRVLVWALDNQVVRYVTNFGLLIFGTAAIFTGFTIQIGFHMGSHGKISLTESVLGLLYVTWSDIHKLSIVVVTILSVIHVTLHWKWYKKTFTKRNLLKNQQVLLLSTIFLISAILGYIPWMIHLTGQSEVTRKFYIEIHDKLTLLLTIYLIFHVVKRFKWFIKAELFPRHLSQTPFIMLESKKCQACWQCLDACENEVLDRVSILKHRHAKIGNGANCTGCLQCSAVCEAGAILKL